MWAVLLLSSASHSSGKSDSFLTMVVLLALPTARHIPSLLIYSQDVASEQARAEGLWKCSTAKKAETMLRTSKGC
jgi:hypothetical protein